MLFRMIALFNQSQMWWSIKYQFVIDKSEDAEKNGGTSSATVIKRYHFNSKAHLQPNHR